MPMIIGTALLPLLVKREEKLTKWPWGIVGVYLVLCFLFAQLNIPISWLFAILWLGVGISVIYVAKLSRKRVDVFLCLLSIIAGIILTPLSPLGGQKIVLTDS